MPKITAESGDLKSLARSLKRFEADAAALHREQDAEHTRMLLRLLGALALFGALFAIGAYLENATPWQWIYLGVLLTFLSALIGLPLTSGSPRHTRWGLLNSAVPNDVIDSLSNTLSDGACQALYNAGTKAGMLRWSHVEALHNEVLRQARLGQHGVPAVERSLHS